MMSRMFAYARVSTAEQTNSNQRQEIEAAGYAIAPQRFIEEHISGSVQAGQRPAFAKLLDRLESGDLLVVTKIDRIGRDSIDVQQTISQLKERGVRLVVLQLGNLDLTSPMGELVLKVMAAFADFERELIVERTLAGQARARAEGKHMGRPSKTTQEARDDILARLIAGESVSALAKHYKVSRGTIINIREQQRPTAATQPL